MMLLFLKLILAHLIGDFAWQPKKWEEDQKVKKQKSPYLYWHILIHALALLIALQFDLKYWIGVVAIVLSHFLVDLIRLNLTGKINSSWLFFWKQVAHLLVIAGVVTIYEPHVLDFDAIYQPKILLLITAVLLLTVVSSRVMKVLITKWEVEENSTNNALEDAGKYIGILERLFIFVFIVTHNWQAIGFLLAAKSVFRFGDLSKTKDRKLTEYILIGTLLSFGFAIAVSLGYEYFVKQLPQ